MHGSNLFSRLLPQVRGCFDREVGLTAPCTQCWVDNVMSDLKQCVFTCLMWKVGMLPEGASNNAIIQQAKGANGGGSSGSGGSGGSGALNACLLCDERMCGPEFTRCVGVNRRLSGIRSDIDRNASQVCTSVDVGPGLASRQPPLAGPPFPWE